MVGEIAVNLALPGAKEPGRPGLGSKTVIAPLYINPRPLVITPEGCPRVWVMVTQFPSKSAKTSCVVHLLSGLPWFTRSTKTLFPLLILAALPLAYSFDTNSFIGTSVNFGSTTLVS